MVAYMLTAGLPAYTVQPCNADVTILAVMCELLSAAFVHVAGGTSRVGRGAGAHTT